jgi:hypothetical protein
MGARQWQLHGDDHKAADALHKAAVEVSIQHILERLLTHELYCVHSLKRLIQKKPLKCIRNVIFIQYLCISHELLSFNSTISLV